jgi:DNA polymerase III delta prime subunit
MTVEAEQALLKLLEEPPLTTAFLFCVPESVFILPTLLSRFSVVGGHLDRPLTPSFVEFVSMAVPARITLVGEKLTAKDMDWQQEIKQGLLAYLTKQTGVLAPEVVAALYYVAEHLLTRGASNKQLFEELAFSLPFKAEAESGTLYK